MRAVRETNPGAVIAPSGKGTKAAMRRIRGAAAGAVTITLLTAATACGGGSSSGGSNASPKTLTYWASNQGASIEIDKKTLAPELAKFEKQIGIKDRFVDSALGSTGAEGKDPAAVPLYSMAYALYYNKQMFADAGIANPPATWDELVADGKKLSKGGKW